MAEGGDGDMRPERKTASGVAMGGSVIREAKTVPSVNSIRSTCTHCVTTMPSGAWLPSTSLAHSTSTT